MKNGRHLKESIIKDLESHITADTNIPKAGYIINSVVMYDAPKTSGIMTETRVPKNVTANMILLKTSNSPRTTTSPMKIARITIAYIIMKAVPLAHCKKSI